MNAPTAPTMVGTTGTHYDVLVTSQVGMFGFRELHDGSVRLRVVPSGPEHVQPLSEILKDGQWKQPGPYDFEPEFRFSTMVWGLDEAYSAAKLACIALGVTDMQTVDEVRQWSAACFASHVSSHIPTGWRSDDESFKMPELGPFAKFCEGLAAFVRRLMPG